MEKAVKAINDFNEQVEIIKKCRICHIGMVDKDKPYVLAFNFGYNDRCIYIHSSKEGKKIDVLRRNKHVCAEFDTDHDLFSRHEHVACSWRMRYRSVIIHGQAEFVEEFDKKIEALKIIMNHYSDTEFSFSTPAVNNVAIIKIAIEEITGRSFEY